MPKNGSYSSERYAWSRWTTEEIESCKRTGELIKLLLKRDRRSRRELAEVTGVKESTIDRLCFGIPTGMRVPQVISLAKALGISPSSLLQPQKELFTDFAHIPQ